MTLTHGDRLLAQAERRARRLAARRRLLLLGLPTVLVTAASIVTLYRAQHEWVVSSGASGPAHVGAHAAMIVFTTALVALPSLGAVRSRRMLPALIAALAGPLLTPRLFGPGGWRWWQSFVLLSVCVLVSAASWQRRARRAQRPAAT